MEVRLLGTGDAIGTPKVGCPCPQCREARGAGHERLRTSLLLTIGAGHILVDTGPDLRRQLLDACSPIIDAAIWTHGHYDHFMGFGEFYRVQAPPPVHASPEVLDYCARVFSFLSFPQYAHEPMEPFTLCDAEITLVPVNHPPQPAYGLRIEADGAVLAYTGDTRADIPAASIDLLRGADLLLVDAIAPAGYQINKHMTYDEALSLAARLEPTDFRCVHLSHLVPWDLPHLGRDGEAFILGKHMHRPSPSPPRRPRL